MKEMRGIEGDFGEGLDSLFEKAACFSQALHIVFWIV